MFHSVIILEKASNGVLQMEATSVASDSPVFLKDCDAKSQRHNHPAKSPEAVNVDHTINECKLTPLHWKIWLLSSMGIFLEGFNLFVIGIALPLIVVSKSPSIMLEGVIGAAAIAGTVFGSFIMGSLADIWGRKKFYIMNMAFVIIFSVLSGVLGQYSLYALVICQFFLGIGVGADYPICAAYVSEFMPARFRGRMLMGTFSFQAVGMVGAALLGLLMMDMFSPHVAWRAMLVMGAVPATIVMIMRLFVPESPRWCIEHGHEEKAAEIIAKFSHRSHKEIKKIVKKESHVITKVHEKALGISSLFSKKYFSRTILAAIPWFLMDIATYGVGIFTPIILGSMMNGKLGHCNLLHKNIYMTEGVTVIDCFLILGFVINIFLVEKLGRIKLQLAGFTGMFIGLLLLGGASFAHNNLILVFSGFIIYNLLMNMGPNATTFILPAELFPTKLRASAHGFSAAFAKVGAVLGIVLLPLIKTSLGTGWTVLLVSVCALAGLVITLLFQVETMGKSIDELSPALADEAMEHHT